MNPLLLTALSYVIGATPTSYWVGRLRGVDLRKEGSGNLGATNTFRVLGGVAAAPVVLVDVLKGWLPVALFPGLSGGSASEWVLAFAGAAIAGHVFSFWVGFRGGKGVATSAGVFLGLAPMAVLAGAVVWIVATFITRIVSVGSLAATLALPLTLWLTPHDGGRPLELFTAAIAAFVIWAHRDNIGRLLRGEEARLGGNPASGQDPESSVREAS